MSSHYGAEPRAWSTFSLLLGLGEDLLPVVSDPATPISNGSSLAAIGKVPSLINGSGEAVGIPGWTQRITTQEEVTRWARNTRLGMCLQTRRARALDIDVEDAALADEISNLIRRHVGELPCRTRGNSAKRLFLFMLEGNLPKRAIRLEKGLVELLGSGQQCIVSGMHPSGARYEWLRGLPEDIPSVSLEKLDAMWRDIASRFQGEASKVKENVSTRAEVLNEAIARDPTAQYLLAHDWVKATERDGRMHIRCPFEAEHTSESAESSTTYFPANTNGYATGNFKCLHGHCEHRTDDEFRSELGVPLVDAFAEFDDLDATVPVQAAASDFDVLPEEAPKAEKAPRFQVIPAAEFAQSRPLDWIVKGLLPKAEIGVVFGDSGSGKTFFALELSGAVARGLNWRGLRTKQGKCAYVCAEGAGGMRGRLKAYARHNGIELEDLPIGIIPDAPNLTQVQDVKDLIRAIKTFGEVSVVVVDTFAQVMAGANENSGEDVGKALSHCRQIHKHTGALVLLVHHSGKNSDKGARGWSGLRAAADVEIEVQRHDDTRLAKVTKMKDGADGAEFGFKLVDVPIGIDEDGDVISSCVVEEAEIVHTAKAEKHDIIESRILHATEELVGMTGRDADAALIVENVVESLLAPPEGKKDTRREKVMKAVMALQEAGRLIVQKGRLSLPKNEGADDG